MASVAAVLLLTPFITAYSISSASSSLNNNGTDELLARSSDLVTLDVDQALFNLSAKNPAFGRQEKLVGKTYSSQVLLTPWKLNVKSSLNYSSHETARSVQKSHVVVKRGSDRSETKITLESCFHDRKVLEIYLDGQPDYDERAWVGHNELFPNHPIAVVIAHNIEDVQNAVICARAAKVPVQPRAGGHSVGHFSSGYAAGGVDPVIIDVSKLNTIEYDKADHTVTVGGGVLLGNLALALLEKGRAISQGDCPSVGIAGHTLHGGVGHTSRMWGLSTNFIIGIDVVTADGSIITASEEENEDLFYAMRGAGSSFGIAVKLKLSTALAPEEVVGFEYESDYESAAAAARSFVEISRCVQSDDFNDKYAVELTVLDHGFDVNGLYFGAKSEFERAMDQCFQDALGPDMLPGDVSSMDFATYLQNTAGSTPLREPPNGYNSPQIDNNAVYKTVMLAEDQIERLEHFFNKCLEFSTDIDCSFRLLGGKDSQVPQKGSSSAISWRENLWITTIVGTEGTIGFANYVYGILADANKERSTYGFQPLLDGVLSKDDAHETYYSSEDLAKLEKIKAKYDPEEVFQNPHSIEPKG